jgi:hypothetical protein
MRDRGATNPPVQRKLLNRIIARENPFKWRPWIHLILEPSWCFHKRRNCRSTDWPRTRARVFANERRFGRSFIQRLHLKRLRRSKALSSPAPRPAKCSDSVWAREPRASSAKLPNYKIAWWRVAPGYSAHRWSNYALTRCQWETRGVSDVTASFSIHQRCGARCHLIFIKTQEATCLPRSLLSSRVKSRGSSRISEKSRRWKSDRYVIRVSKRRDVSRITILRWSEK